MNLLTKANEQYLEEN